MAAYTPPDKKQMNQLQELIENNFRAIHELKFYCQTMGITIRRLNKITLFYYNKTLYQLLQDRIHREARYLLSQTTLSAKEICYQLGVCDPAHFTKCFKQQEGVSPREFRYSRKKPIQHTMR